jgi:hypothetical protein
MDWLRQNSAMKRQRICGLRPVGDTVGVSGTGIHGVMRCGSRVCPCCSESLSKQVRDNVMAGVSQWRAAGGLVLFGTHTVRHNLSQSFEFLADAVADCWAHATGGRGWLRDRRDHGIEHYMRVFEQKYSPENGWHIHVHYLLFVHPMYARETNTDALLTLMFDRWRRRAQALGLGKALRKAQDLRVVESDEEAANIADYVAKQVTADSASMDAGDMGWEMSNPNGKGDAGGMTPAQILEHAMRGDDFYRMLWHEYERGMKGRRAVAYSRGFREMFDLGAELTVQELAEKEDRETAEIDFELRAASYKVLVQRPGRRSEMMDRLRRTGPAATVDWIHEVGRDLGVELEAWVWKRDRAAVVFAEPLGLCDVEPAF